MNKKKLTKALAVAMAATMMVGMSLTALAENPTSGTGTADGTGTSNGHVEMKVVSVTLPTSVGTTFDYIADPEDLVGQTKPAAGTTGKTKEGTEVTPNTDYIYFHNAAITADDDKGIVAQSEGYSSTSDTVRVTNKSSVKINLTVSAAVAANDNNMAIADAATALATATSTPTVHFDLLTKVKGAASADETAVTTTDGVAKAEKANIEVAGTAANFELTQTGTGASGTYVYGVKSSVKDKDWTWVDISLKGACSKAKTTDELVAPKFVMTWSWADPDAAPAAPESYTVTFDSKGGSSVAAATVTAGGKATAPTDPTKAGNTFAGWFTSADGGETLSEQAFDFDTAINAATTLYAKWTPYGTATASGSWSGSTLYIGKDASHGFTGDSVAVAVSKDNSTFVDLESADFEYNEYKWVGLTWDTLTTALADDALTAYYVRVTDGTTYYTYSYGN